MDFLDFQSPISIRMSLNGTTIEIPYEDLKQKIIKKITLYYFFKKVALMKKVNKKKIALGLFKNLVNKNTNEKSKKKFIEVPSLDRIPLPEIAGAVSQAKRKISSSAQKTQRAAAAAATFEAPQSIRYTIHSDAAKEVLCVDVTRDSTLLAIGFHDGVIKICLLSSLLKHYNLKNQQQLKKHMDLSVGQVENHTNENSDDACNRTLFAHFGFVNSVHFAPQNEHLLSCSDDCTIKIWSTLTWDIVRILNERFGNQVWHVRFSPFGHYFLSCSIETVCKMWSLTENNYLRKFIGHTGSVHCAEFHPNANYVASGAHDCSIRLWDVKDGQMVRFMVVDRNPIYMLLFSKCGRYLLSNTYDNAVTIWNLCIGEALMTIKTETKIVYEISFNEKGNILAIGGRGTCISLWNFKKLMKDERDRRMNDEQNRRANAKHYLLKNISVEGAEVMHLKFIRNNLMLEIVREDESFLSNEYKSNLSVQI